MIKEGLREKDLNRKKSKKIRARSVELQRGCLYPFETSPFWGVFLKRGNPKKSGPERRHSTTHEESDD
jgi:hypothetical protein